MKQIYSLYSPVAGDWHSPTDFRAVAGWRKVGSWKRWETLMQHAQTLVTAHPGCVVGFTICSEYSLPSEKIEVVDGLILCLPGLATPDPLREPICPDCQEVDCECGLPF